MENAPVTLEHGFDHVAECAHIPDYYENYAFWMVASSDEHDILMYTCMYVIKGGPGGSVWLDGDTRQHITLLSVTPIERRGKGMYDNNFARVGWHPTQYGKPEDLKVTRGKDRVVWEMDGQRYIHKPPVFSVKGTHAGVEMDLDFRPAGPAFFRWGAMEGAGKADRAGYKSYVFPKGTIKVGGKTYEIKSGWGTQGHQIIMRPNYDIVGEWLAPHDMYELDSITSDNVLIYLSRPTKGVTGQVRVGDKIIDFQPDNKKGSISFTVLEHWHDPRSGQNVPCRWHLAMASPEGTIDMDIQGQNRAYYQWDMKKGNTELMWIMCVGNGNVFMPDGRTVPIKDTLMRLEWCHTTKVAVESIDGPVL